MLKTEDRAAAKKRLADLAQDSVGVVGAGLIVAGCWMIYPPVAVIFAGVALLGVAVLAAKKN